MTGPRLLIVLAASLPAAWAIAQQGASVQPAQLQRLGAWPLCEASAAVRNPSSPKHVFVADNERPDLLFDFELGEHGLRSMRPVEIPGSGGLRDLEALTASGSDLLLVGSHSRNRRCAFRAKRWQLRWLRVGTGRLQELATLDSSRLHRQIASGPARCLAALFDPHAPAPAGANAFCEVLAQRERLEATPPCQTLNIEGAVTLPAAADGSHGEPRIWLGLRSPRVAGRAVLLRLDRRSDSLRFDGIAFIDLAGRGIRELAYANNTLWGIAGPVSDETEHFTLFGIPAAGLVPGATLPEPTTQRPLPPSSEGLVMDANRAIVLIDGSNGRDGSQTCQVDASQTVIPLPAVAGRWPLTEDDRP